MRSEAFKLTSFTAVVSAVGFLLRWLQDMRIADEEAGLAANAPISWLVAGIMVLMAAALAVYVTYLRRFDAPAEADKALVGSMALSGMISMIPPVLLALAGAVQIIHPGDGLVWPTLHRIGGGMMILGALGGGIIAMNVSKAEQVSACRKGAVLMILFGLFWIVSGYRDAATDPQVWRFVTEILAQSGMLLAVYYVAGFFFNSPHPWWALYTCNLGAFLCIMCAIDDNGLGQSMAFAAMALQLLLWSFTITENLKTKPIQPVMPGDKVL